MKKLSTPRIIVVLCIANIYLFINGVIGELGAYPAEAAEVTPPAAEITEEAPNGMGTVDFIIEDSAAETSAPTVVSVPAMSWYKPSAMDYFYETMNGIETSSSTEPTEETTPEMTSDELAFDEPTYDETTEEATTAVTSEATAQTTTPETTTASPTTTTPTPTTTTTPTTTAPPTTTAAPGTPSPSTTTTLRELSVEDDIIIETITTTKAPETTPAPVETPAPSNGSDVTLTVSNGGVRVSGKAVDIISKIVANEIGSSFDDEAIKAQAVAAYTFVSYFNQNDSVPSVILKDSVPDNVYKAVSSVIGQAVYYNGKLIQAVYSASSAGFTASSYNVWGSDLPYLKSVECDLDAKYDPNYGVVRSVSAATIKENVENVTGIKLSGDKKNWLYVESREDGQYVAQLVVGGQRTYMDGAKERKISGRVFRELIMSYGIRSAAFDVYYDTASDSFIFTTYGYGHGVGLSQNGAQALAVYKGYNYVEILKHYYQGCEIY